MRVVDRTVLAVGRTFGNQVLTCGWRDGRRLQVLCKHGAGAVGPVYGHKAGVEYEATVYAHALQGLPLTLPRYYGAFRYRRKTCLVIGYLPNAFHIYWAPEAIVPAAEWIGRFHAANETRTAALRIAGLRVHDGRYYKGWIRRTWKFVRPTVRRRYPWLETLCNRPDDLIRPLLDTRHTVAHGEYTPGNILVLDGRIYPIDWESAAITAGEVDVASLTDGWSRRVKRECEHAYRRARWPDGAPPDFDKVMAAADLYQQFRWLGNHPDWTNTPTGKVNRFLQLRTAGERLGVL